MEIVVVLVLALLVFGPKRLPQAGRSLGQAMREFRKATETARTELGLDDVTKGVTDLKSSLNIDLNSATAPAPRQDAAATSVAAVVAPAADKPVPVEAAGSDATSVEAAAAETGAEPAVDELPAAEAAGDDTSATGASGGRDDA
jgi:sec-independent protein translocase protein TatA